MSRSRFDTEQTAIHEAGHAVGAAAMGYALESVTIEPTRKHSGYCLLTRPPMSHTDSLIYQLCGPVAESQWVGGRLGMNDAHGWRTDVERCGDALAMVRESSTGNPWHSAEFRSAAKSAFSIIRTNWRVVDHIAKLLITHRVLSGADVAVAMHKLRGVGCVVYTEAA